MVFIEKIKFDTFIIKVYVKPNSKKQEINHINLEENFLTINLRSKPVQNKANKELLLLLKKKVGKITNSIEIISGFRKKNKVINLIVDNTITKKEIIRLLTD